MQAQVIKNKKIKNKKLIFRQHLCINCGMCTSVCFFGALEINKKTNKLIFEEKNCVVCALCTKACPFNLFSISKND